MRKKYCICRKLRSGILNFFQVAFLFSGGICKTQLLSDKGNTTRDTIPVLLLPLPETRNIRNLVKKINLVFMKWFWLVLWTYCTSFCSWSPWHEPSYLDEVPGKTATPKSVSGDPSHLPQSHSEWPAPSKPLSFSHLRKEPSQVPEDQFFI